MESEFLKATDLPTKSLEFLENLYSDKNYFEEIHNLEKIILEKYISKNYIFNVVISSGLNVDLLKAHFLRNGFNVNSVVLKLDENSSKKLNGLMFKL